MAEKSRFLENFGVMDAVDIRPPSNYKVVLLNDDYTTKEFVVMILEKIFHKSEQDSIKIMESVHKSGKGVAGVYSFDIASTRQQMTVALARKQGYPLRCELEEC